MNCDRAIKELNQRVRLKIFVLSSVRVDRHTLEHKFTSNYQVNDKRHFVLPSTIDT